jgi:hypothetical protein
VASLKRGRSDVLAGRAPLGGHRSHAITAPQHRTNDDVIEDLLAFARADTAAGSAASDPATVAAKSDVTSSATGGKAACIRTLGAARVAYRRATAAGWHGIWWKTA